MSLVLIAALPFLGALLPGLMIRAGRDVCATAAGGITLLALIGLLVHAPSVLAGEVVREGFEWLPALGLNATFFLDPLGLMFAGLILGIGLLIILYARYYLSPTDSAGEFFTYLLLFQGAMVGIVLSDNVLLLIVFWELTSLSSFLLIGYWKHLPEGRQGARMALAVTGMGGLALIGGMLILGDIAGGYELTTILQNKEAIQDSPLYLPALLLILLGCFTKSAQFPFHFWLPHAMAAPTPVSAYLHSATMVKAGLFLMARLWPVLSGTEAWFYIVATTGLVTMVLGAVIALFKDDLKALLAFSTVSHLGLITMLLGFGTQAAATAAVLHIIMHATFKAALFMTAGIVDHEAHTRDIRRLGGLRTLMPVTFALATLAALSMAGIPPLNGFLSKELMLEEASHTVWGGVWWLLPAAVTLGATFSAAYSFRYIAHAFLGPVRDDYPSKPHDPGFGLWAAPALLVALVVVFGLWSDTLLSYFVASVAGAVTQEPLPYFHLALWHGFTPALFMSMFAVAVGALLVALHAPLDRAWRAAPRPEAKAIFDGMVEACAAGAGRLTDAMHDGALSRYLAIFTLAVAGAGAVAWFGGTMGPPTRAMLPVAFVPTVGWFLLVVSTLALAVFHRNRILALVLVGVIGLVVSLGFVYLSAPDLALTQISVEVVTVILLLLALNFLPKETPRESGTPRRVRDAVLSGAAGLGVAGLIYALMRRDFSAESISAYHVENSYTGGGGTNIVNVILVDFRGYDTFGEIIVLGIASLAIFAMTDAILSGPVGRRLAIWSPHRGDAGDVHPLMMVVATRVMMPIVLMVGVYILLRGHNLPGGGFIAGLVVAIALVMQYMASGIAWAEARQRHPYHAVVAAGVLVAAATGIGAWFSGTPFLTSAFGYVTLPPLEKFELATAMAFDLGVFMTVVGSVMLALSSISRLALGTGEKVYTEPMGIDPARGASTPEEG